MEVGHVWPAHLQKFDDPSFPEAILEIHGTNDPSFPEAILGISSH